MMTVIKYSAEHQCTNNDTVRCNWFDRNIYFHLLYNTLLWRAKPENNKTE